MWKGMQGGDCGERDAGTGNRHEGGGSMEMNVGRGLWGNGCREGTVWKGMQGGDCVERDAGRGLWGKGCGDWE